MKAKQFFWSFLALLWLLPSSASDDPFVGFFSGEHDGKRYGVTIDRVNSTTYAGLLQIDADKMQLDARRFGEWIGGMLRSHTVELRFRAELKGSALIVQTADERRVVL